MPTRIKDYGMTERTFDWVSRHDPESKKYAIRSTLRGRDIVKKKTIWQPGVVLDQGSEGACVGFAWTADLLAKPVPPKEQPPEHVGNSFAIGVYKEAQKIDEWPGESYEGTSVLAGAKIIKGKGFIQEYRWCFGIDDVRDAVISEGPVVVGVPWYEGMYETLPGGLVRLSGKKVGGHAITIIGYDPAMRINGRTYEVFKWRNSWGSSYGVSGSGYIRYNDLAKLLAQQGEACVPMGRKTPVFRERSKQTNNKTNLFSLLKGLFTK
jgi:hypothetical protein